MPDPADPAFLVRHPPKLQAEPNVSRWAPVRREAVARQAPAPRAEPVARVRTRTPEETRNVVQVLGRTQRSGGRLWVRIRLPSGMRERLGWLDRRALGGYGFVRTRLIVELPRLRATLLRGGDPVFSTAIGVGGPGSPTPTGEFYVRNMLTRYRSPEYGPIAFGTSARSDLLTDWPAGGFVGIHGTDRPDLLPGRVSHGCIRMPNRAIRRLVGLMPVGTPLTIR
ncbi:MAG: L,D-transpeptidase family protein [Solirubrobacterales bacterium]|nr:L,D-transpeptidase family protein [Solirubrobacterales bacterium]